MDIEKLRHVLEHVLPRIAPAEFDMDSYVSEHDGECGTVCCIAGWFPRHWPEAGFTWEKGAPPRLYLASDGPYLRISENILATFGCTTMQEEHIILRLFGFFDTEGTFGTRTPTIARVRKIWMQTLRLLDTKGAEAAESYLNRKKIS